MLDKPIFFYQFLEFGLLDEVVVLSVNFMWTRFTGGVYGDNEGSVQIFCALRLARLGGCVGRTLSLRTQTSEERKKTNGKR